VAMCAESRQLQQKEVSGRARQFGKGGSPLARLCIILRLRLRRRAPTMSGAPRPRVAPLASRESLSLPALGAAGCPRAPSTYDHSTLPLELRHKGIYQADCVSRASMRCG
jgi:hypothetical protein